MRDIFKYLHPIFDTYSLPFSSEALSGDSEEELFIAMKLKP